MGAHDLPADYARAETMAAAMFAEFFRPPANQTVSQWADSNRMLSGKSSSEPGPWRTDRTPYLRQIMDDLSARSTVQEVAVMFAAQLGKSETGNNWLGYIIDNEPGPVMCVQPTTDMAKRFSRQRIAPMLEETPALRRKVRENRSRDDANTTLMKDFAGGVLVISGANSAASLRSMPVRYLFLDEIDAYPQDVDGEGSPIVLAEKRTSTFARRKVLKVSTPTIKHFSRIEASYQQSNACIYHVPCPHCGEYQPLEWGTGSGHGLRWRKDEAGMPITGTVRYVCAASGCEIEEHQKPGMLAAGRWVPTRESTRPGLFTGYHLNALYAPLGWVSWADLVQQFTEAHQADRRGDKSRLKTFVNTALAETWEIKGEGGDASALAARAEKYDLGTVPRGGLMVTMGVDIQPDRIEARVWAFGRGEESWLVARHILYGDPNLDEGTEGSPWTRLTEIRRTPILHASGAQMVIEGTGIDTGGHNTNAVYGYCRSHAHANVLAFKGASTYGRPVIGKPSLIDVTWRGKTTPRSLKLWIIGTDTAKHLLYGRMRLTQPGPGYIHLPDSLVQTDEFDQMTASRLMPVTVQGKQSLRWITPSGKREEAGDCQVYAYAIACFLGIQTFREPSWARREAKYAPREPDLFAAAPAPEESAPAHLQAPTEPAQQAPTRPNTATLRRRPGAFVKGWK
jgi:phage terminase large subunit GpA-like protein